MVNFRRTYNLKQMGTPILVFSRLMIRTHFFVLAVIAKTTKIEKQKI